MSDNNVLGYIPDGYTLAGYIKGEDRLYPALRFQYRPMLVQDRSVIMRHMSKVLEDPDEMELVGAKAIAARLVSWDLKNVGKILPRTTDVILRMQPELEGKLFRIICGQLPSDIDPELDGLEKQEIAEQRIARALGGTVEQEEVAQMGN